MSAGTSESRSSDSKMTLVWQELTVSPPPSGRWFSTRSVWRMIRGAETRRTSEPAPILKGVSGYAEAGNLIAIMGPSGAGKTTLLASIAMRVEPTRGIVRVNGQTISKEAMFRISSYMPQFDVLPSSLTVQEHISFACALRRNEPASQRGILAEKLVLEVGLSDQKDRIVSVLSDGERKRLSLATELITEPRILFLDEPTTGLDAYTARRVVDCLRSIAATGTIVICTIHQPGAEVYRLFGQVIFLTGGCVGYFGTLENATAFFSSIGHRCPAEYEESDYYVKTLSVRDSDEEESRDRVRLICEKFAESRPYCRPAKSAGDTTPGFRATRRRANWARQIGWLLWRTWVQSRRRLFADWIGWLSYLLSVVTVAGFYAGVDPSTQAGVQNARGALYMMSSEIIFTVAYSVIYELPADLPIFVRESGFYGAGPYFLATFFGLMPKVVAKAFLFTVVLYCALALERGVVGFLFYCSSTTAAAVCGAAYGVMFSSWIREIEIATSIMVPIDMFFLLTAGVFYNIRSLPTCLACAKYFSMFFYVNEALAILYWSQVEEIECEANTDLPCLRNGTEVLSEYGFEPSNYWRDTFGLLLLAVVMAFVGYLGIKRKRRPGSFFESLYI